MIIRVKQFLITILALLITLILLKGIPVDKVEVSDQPVGVSIYIKKLSLKKSGFIVVRKGENIIAHSDYLPQGIYKDFNIDPFFLQPAAEAFSPGVVDILLYRDNGDNYFDSKLDAKIENNVHRKIMLYSGNEIRDGLEKILVKCSGGSSFDFGCFRSEVKPMIKKESLNELLTELETAFSQGSFKTRTCHGPAHVIGEEAGETMSFEAINSACSRKCDYGCLHGAFSTEIRAEDRFPEIAPSYCSQFASSEVEKDFEACSHIVGHALSERFGNDVKSALGVCSGISDNRGRIECHRGVFMEFLMGSPDNPAKKFENPDELFNFCSGFEPDLNGQCFGYLGFYAYSLFGSEQAHSLCAKVDETQREGCYYSLGSASYFYLRDNTEGLVALCNKSGKFSGSCIRGAIEIFVGEEKYKDKALLLCESQEPRFRAECNRFWCEKVKWAWGTTSSCEPGSLR